MVQQAPSSISSASVTAMQEAEEAFTAYVIGERDMPPIALIAHAQLLVSRDIAEHLADISGRLQQIESHTLDTANNTRREGDVPAPPAGHAFERIHGAALMDHLIHSRADGGHGLFFGPRDGDLEVLHRDAHELEGD